MIILRKKKKQSKYTKNTNVCMRLLVCMLHRVVYVFTHNFLLLGLAHIFGNLLCMYKNFFNSKWFAKLFLPVNSQLRFRGVYLCYCVFPAYLFCIGKFNSKAFWKILRRAKLKLFCLAKREIYTYTQLFGIREKHKII